jgi:hypothetical protein
MNSSSMNSSSEEDDDEIWRNAVAFPSNISESSSSASSSSASSSSSSSFTAEEKNTLLKMRTKLGLANQGRPLSSTQTDQSIKHRENQQKRLVISTLMDRSTFINNFVQLVHKKYTCDISIILCAYFLMVLSFIF